MKCLFALIICFGLLNLGTAAHAESSFAEPQYSAQCLLEAVLRKKELALRPELEIPKIYLASQANLNDFQDAVEPQWNFRPFAIISVYIIKKNEIYLYDDAKYYKRFDRFIDDSLAHELTHYVQDVYQGANIMEDNYLEEDAVHVQNWIRENYLNKNISPCAAE